MTRRRFPGLTVRCLLAASAVVASAAEAQEARVPAGDTTARPAATVHDVTRATQLLGTVMSPFCPGLTLANCPSVYAETLRVSVRARLDAGEEPDSIVESLVAAFGEEIRGAPRARGLGLVLWALPLVALLAGGLGVAWWLRRSSRRTPLVPAGGDMAGVGLTPAETARLAAALRECE